MLKTIQIIALFQGVFLIFILFQHRRKYKNIDFYLLLASLISVLLFSLGDDEYNLFVDNADWFFFHDPLIITCFFLFVRYHKSNKSTFQKRDLAFFTPFILSSFFNFLETYSFFHRNTFFQIVSVIVEGIFLAMLIYMIYDIIHKKKEKWLLLFVIPLTIIFIIDEFTYLLTQSNESPFSLDSYGIILMAIFLFYYVLYKLIISPTEVLPKSDIVKYKSSNLTKDSILKIKKQLNQLMNEEKIFKNQKLSVDDVAKELNVPRQKVSEVLNAYMKISFQDFLNEYRVNEFVSNLSLKKYENYTLLAIAYESGFSSKSTFNTVFKKLKGTTPSKFRKEVLKNSNNE
ncbi:helix-turn-helix domain-containing protein [Tenacibaculum xiamenense]|uniref:helix-turn-helix domain-containing protein n=1 Tax=Tenacibaculum xiamenense TaxID=1261553 RepID=UPI003892DBD9